MRIDCSQLGGTERSRSGRVEQVDALCARPFRHRLDRVEVMCLRRTAGFLLFFSSYLSRIPVS